jgi:hypothetical protein
MTFKEMNLKNENLTLKTDEIIIKQVNELSIPNKIENIKITTYSPAP